MGEVVYIIAKIALISLFYFYFIKPLIAGDNIVYYFILKCLNFGVPDCYKGHCGNLFPYLWFGPTRLFGLDDWQHSEFFSLESLW